MRNLALILITFTLILTACQNSDKKCCDTDSANSMAALASDKSFKDAHEAPLPLEINGKGKMISFPSPDGKNGTAYFISSSNKTNNYLFVFHEWWGLNDYIKQTADSYSDSLGVNVIAIDLYDGKVATNSSEAGTLVQSNVTARSQAIIKGGLNYAGKDAKVATLGWCFGGGWSMQGALLAGRNETGCVMYYGMPETDVTKLKSLNSNVLFIWANKDQWINADVKNSFVSNMKTAGKELTVKEYSADHAFANPSNPHYEKDVTADAQKITIDYLRKSFSR
ncbi:MAG: dienelactone hydrolase family protein [Chitinophagales bacterium]|nr:dienelactone hydrolase family protein [Chitinophagales bacterium]